MVDKPLLIDRGTSGAGSTLNWQGGSGVVTLSGEFGGATVEMYVSFQPDIWVGTGAEGTFTTESARGFTLPPCQLRAEVTNATGTTDITMLARSLA